MKLAILPLALVAISAPAFSQDAMSEDSMSEGDSMGAMSEDNMSEDHMGTMMMMEGGEVIAIMPDGHMGTMMMDTDKMNSTVGMSAPLDECVMFIIGSDGKTYQVEMDTQMAQDECMDIAL